MVAERRVVFLVFPRVQVLDITGPLEVFSLANYLAAAAGDQPPYRTEVVAEERGPLPTSNGLEIVAQRAYREIQDEIDTLVVPGGLGSREVRRDGTLSGWLQSAAGRSRRVTSVCTGAFLLAEAGLLDGRHATTHWSACQALARRYPRVTVEPDPIYVRDGNVYTSAGVTAGMDLALALVDEDLGAEMALAVARQLVIFVRRPGGQSQFSAQLAAQAAGPEPVRAVQSWIVEHPSADLSVEALAERAAMSPRNFARVFRREAGVTPAVYVERVRVESARRLLECTAFAVDEIARRCGFGTPETMRRAFARCIGTPPSEYRSRFPAHHLTTH